MQVALAATRLLRKKGGRGGANFLADVDARNGTRGRGRRRGNKTAVVLINDHKNKEGQKEMHALRLLLERCLEKRE